MKKSYEERAKTFIRRICKLASEERIQLASNGSFRSLANVFNEFSSRQRIKVQNGCARTVLITSDYVVKIDTGIDDYGTCEDEVRVYNYAVAHGFEKIFTKPTPYAYNGINFYIYPRVHHIGRKYKGRDFWKCLSNNELFFLDDYIEDLHNNNIGFYKNGSPVVLDYACAYDLD